MSARRVDNEEVAALLDEVADLLSQKEEANFFRISSYRRAAQGLRHAALSVEQLYEDSGVEGLQEIYGVGARIASLIEEYLETGRSTLLESLRAEASPEQAFAQLPGIGEVLAHRIADQLSIETFEELEMAVHDERLQQIPGIGEKKTAGIGDALAGRLSRSALRRMRQRLDGRSAASSAEPNVALLLEIDDQYRRKADDDQLRRIAPRRFNPDGEKWLPVMNTQREGWDFTALFSNTRRAHELGKTRDWVVIYFEREDQEGQSTVVTAQRGRLRGRRVIAGREAECQKYYEERSHLDEQRPS